VQPSRAFSAFLTEKLGGKHRTNRLKLKKCDSFHTIVMFWVLCFAVSESAVGMKRTLSGKLMRESDCRVEIRGVLIGKRSKRLLRFMVMKKIQLISQLALSLHPGSITGKSKQNSKKCVSGLF
jgi:hypothetical protein